MLMRCEMCGGQGTVKCPACQKPLSPEKVTPPNAASASDPADNKCPQCGGSGQVECLGCLGSGFVDMPCIC